MPARARAARRLAVAVLAALGALGAALFAGAVAGASPAPATVTDGLDARFGSSSQHVSGTTLEQRLGALESSIGADVRAVRLYHAWDERFPTSHERFLAGSDVLPVLSIDTRRTDGTRVGWDALAAAQPGSQLHAEMVARIDEVVAFGRPVVLSLNHEPDWYRNGGSGRAADYRAAYRRFVQVLRSRGATNVSTMFIGVAWHFDPRATTKIADWYPGDDVVDYVGGDGYNWHTCQGGAGQPWRSFEEIFAPVRAFGQQHPSVRLMVGEFGTVERADDPDAKGGWFREAARSLATPEWSQFDLVLYWNRTHESFPGCRFAFGTSAASLAGAGDMARSALFTQPATTTTTSPTTTTTAPTTTTTTAAATKPTPTSIAGGRPLADGLEAVGRTGPGSPTTDGGQTGSIALRFGGASCRSPHGHGPAGRAVAALHCTR